MAFGTPPFDHHVEIDGVPYKVDESLDSTYIPSHVPYRRRADVVPMPRWPNTMEVDSGGKARWFLTNWGGGEGQNVLEAGDDFGATRYYRSEGLNFRVPGQFSLNTSAVLSMPPSTGAAAATTYQGNADMTDVTGVSTASGTDRRLNTVNDEVKTTNFTPGASQRRMDFYIYTEGVQLTQILGSALTKVHGNWANSGNSKKMVGGPGLVKSAATGPFTAGNPVEVRFYMHVQDVTPARVALRIHDDGTGKVIKEKILLVSNTSAPANPSVILNFTPRASITYRFEITCYNGSPIGNIPGTTFFVDELDYGHAKQETTVRVKVRNQTGSTDVVNKTVTVFAEPAGVKVASLTYTAAGATAYSGNVIYLTGKHRPWVDKVVDKTTSTSAWSFDCMELGQGGNIWVAGDRAGVVPNTWTYDFSGSEDWVERQSLTGATVGNTVKALAHTDAYEYALCSNSKVYKLTTTTTQQYTAATTGTAVGMAICQDRLFVLTEDTTNGVRVELFAVDAAGPDIARTSTITVTTAGPTGDTKLKHRMTRSPTGARFFVNHSDATATVYECDASGTSPRVRIIGELEPGEKITSITYTGGLTFLGGQFIAETGQTPRSGLAMIDQNGFLSRVGYLRRDDPDSRPPTSMQAYEHDLWILQGNYVWRYSLQSGGLFLEYQLDPGTPANQRSIAVYRGHQFAAYSDEGVYVTGAVSTYRQSGVSGANQFVSSIFDAGQPGVDKLLEAIDVHCDTLPSNTSVKVEYQIDQSGTWVQAGTMSQGTNSRLPVSDGDGTVIFDNLQLRVTPFSRDGVGTPVVKAIVPQFYSAEQIEYLDLALLCTDEDSSFHSEATQNTGAERATHLWGIWRAKALATLVDGYSSPDPDVNPSHLVRVEDIDDRAVKLGERTMFVTFRIIR